MEKFLIDECKQSQIHRLEKVELAMLFTVLLNCQDTFSREIAGTFENYIRLEYGLAEVRIT